MKDLLTHLAAAGIVILMLPLILVSMPFLLFAEWSDGRKRNT